MRKEYDFSESIENPYTEKLKRQITIRIDAEAIAYFKNLANETGMPYQKLINLYLSDCARSHRKLSMKWE